MQRFWLKFGRTGVALVAACMLVLQALIGSFAVGAAAASPMLDAFGNPLCISSASAADPMPLESDRGAMPDCCAVSCSMFAPLVADQPHAHSLSNPLEIGSSEQNLSHRYTGPAPVFERGPGSPRSPPATSA